MFIDLRYHYYVTLTAVTQMETLSAPTVFPHKGKFVRRESRFERGGAHDIGFIA